MKPICLILALAFLLTGCTHDPVPAAPTTQPATIATQSQTTPPTQSPAVAYRGEDWDSGYVITEDWGVFCPHMDTDVYVPLRFCNAMGTILILSRTEIDPDAIDVTLETELPYTMAVSRAPDFQSERNALETYFDAHLYAAYQGWDWEEHRRNNVGYDPETASQAQWDAKLAHDTRWTEEISNQWSIAIATGEGIPQFYAYGVVFHIDEAAAREDTTITHVNVSWPGVSFRHEFGELRIHPGYPEACAGFPNQLDGVGDAGGSMFSNGLSYQYHGPLEDGMLGGFIAGKEIALIRGYALDENDQISDLRLVYQGEDGAVDRQWDENTKVWLDPGTYVEVWAKAGSPQTFWSVCDEHFYYCIEYECDGVRDVIIFNNHQRSDGNPFVLWGLYFEETSLRAYYDDYLWADRDTVLP
ncbi:MAG: hypothetical protein E7459_06750 [Ruminococcaceae bacterium]|nr:hypothetical protein [Oscillospiraceae bacterium]